LEGRIPERSKNRDEWCKPLAIRNQRAIERPKIQTGQASDAGRDRTLLETCAIDKSCRGSFLVGLCRPAGQGVFVLRPSQMIVLLSLAQKADERSG
jgi:hypothetical protein